MRPLSTRMINATTMTVHCTSSWARKNYPHIGSLITISPDMPASKERLDSDMRWP